MTGKEVFINTNMVNTLLFKAVIFDVAKRIALIDKQGLTNSKTADDEIIINSFFENLQIDAVEENSENPHRKTLLKHLEQDDDYAGVLNIYSLCAEHEIVIRLVELALVCLWKPELEKFLSKFFKHSITIEMCETIWPENADSRLRTDQYKLAKTLLVATNRHLPNFRQPFLADDVLSDYVLKNQQLDYRLKGIVETVVSFESLQKLFVNNELVNELSDAILFDKIVHIKGEVGCGRKLLVKHACKKNDLPLLMINTSNLIGLGKNLNDGITRIVRMALFFSYIPCFYEIDAWEDDAIELFIKEVLFNLNDLFLPVIVITDENTAIIPHYSDPIRQLEIPRPSREERTMLWEGYGQQFGFNEINWVIISNKFKMTAEEIFKVMNQLDMRRRRSDIDDRAVMEACHSVIPPAQGDFHLANVKFTIDDLMMPEANKDVLYNICAHVLYRHKVYNEWDMESKFPYGTSVSAMFVGAPGTGKTMAVHVLSNMLNIPIYQIDLSQVVDKYIGETEKHLEEIFDRAQKSNTILFFDEADSVFGKRSEVTNAKDKYANTQVSYILQRIEQYDGIVILATNFKRNIDDAVLRRVRYIVEFQLPNEQTRLSLWKSSFAKNVPLGDIDFEYLAADFELSGGAIKNIALNATFLAARENSSITLKHILSCLIDENRKLGRSMLKQDFGRYAHLLF